MSSEPTYEEYKTATEYARFKYKYGIFVLIACWIALIILIVYIIVYAKELSTHPAIYILEKLNADSCYCMGEGVTYYINKTSITYSSVNFGFG